jgi:hypothetical protein
MSTVVERGASLPSALSTTGGDDDGLVQLLRDLLPKRSPEDRRAEIVRVLFGRALDQREIEIPVLATQPNRRWRALFSERLAAVFDTEAPDGASPQGLTDLLMRMTDMQLELLRAYDDSGALPGGDWLEHNATDTQILDAFLGVTAAAHPLEVRVIETALTSQRLINWIQTRAARYMSSALLSTTGRPDTSSTSSPTSSSSTTSKPRKNGAKSASPSV